MAETHLGGTNTVGDVVLGLNGAVVRRTVSVARHVERFVGVVVGMCKWNCVLFDENGVIMV